MESRALEFYVSALLALALLAGASSTEPPNNVGDNVIVEVKLEKELQLISKSSSSLNESETRTKSFECVIEGLSKDELSLLAIGKSQVYVSGSGNSSSNNFSEQADEQSHSQPFNIEISIVNETVLVKGDVLMRKLKNDFDKTTESNDFQPASCEVIFLEVEDDNEGQKLSENVTKGGQTVEKIPPEITSSYDHVVLINGAPDQVISCSARGHPSPTVRWSFQNCKSNAVGLDSTPSSITPGEINSYLLFSQVNDNTACKNFTCIAENAHGRVTKTFEVEVISVEGISRCNDISDGISPSVTPRNQEVIFNHNIQEILQRFKRHGWYQWRTYKLRDEHIIIDPQPYGGIPTSVEKDGAHNTDLQKMVNFITERLQLADKVAVNKWDNNKPVADPAREQIILENMVRLAENQGLGPDWAQHFFRDQIEANKDVQYELIRLWKIQGRRPDGPPVDLVNEVRPEIDYINGQLIELAKFTERERGDWGCQTEVEKNARYAAFLYNLDPLHQRALQRATENVCTPPFVSQERTPFPTHPYPPPPPH